MPKIPAQTQRTVLPSGGGSGGGSANARGLASKAGGGAAAAGAAISAGAGALSNAFMRAQHERDRILEKAEDERKRIAAKLDSLNQQTGAYQISMKGAQAIQEDEQNLEEQLRSQQDQDPRTWRVTIKDTEGNDMQVTPEAGMQTLLRNRIDTDLETAKLLGPEAVAQVAESLTRDGRMAAAKFGDTHLKLRHDKSLADWQSVTGKLEEQAADPDNRFREKAKLDLDDHIAHGVKAGMFSPTEGVKLKETMKDSIADKWATAKAARDPVTFLTMIEKYQAHAEPVGAGQEGAMGTAVVVDKANRLPEDIRPEKVAHYQQIAYGSLAHKQAENDRIEKAHDKRVKVAQEQNYGEGLARLYKGESIANELALKVQSGELDPDKAESLRKIEHTIKTQNANDPVLIKNSAVKLVDYTQRLTKAKYGIGDDLEAIQQDFTRDLQEGTLLPNNAESIAKIVDEAKGHLVSEAKQAENKEVQTAHTNLMKHLSVGGELNYDALSAEAKTAADTDFWNMKQQHPNMPGWEINELLKKRYDPTVEPRKKIYGDIVNAEFKEAKLQSMVQRKVITPAGAKAIRERAQVDAGNKIVADFLSTYKPPAPSMWERVQNLGQLGSEWFKDDTTEAAP